MKHITMFLFSVYLLLSLVVLFTFEFKIWFMIFENILALLQAQLFFIQIYLIFSVWLKPITKVDSRD